MALVCRSICSNVCCSPLPRSLITFLPSFLPSFTPSSFPFGPAEGNESFYSILCVARVRHSTPSLSVLPPDRPHVKTAVKRWIGCGREGRDGGTDGGTEAKPTCHLTLRG